MFALSVAKVSLNKPRKSVAAFNVKQLHPYIYFLNLHPPPLHSMPSSSSSLHALCAHPLSSRWRSWLIAVVDGCEERREEARWRGEMTGCWGRNDGGAVCALAQILDLGFFRCSHRRSCEMDERQRCCSEMEKQNGKVRKNNKLTWNPEWQHK